MTRVYHPYTAWEDFQNKMWDTLPRSEENAMLQRAVQFTGDATLYGSFMLRVIEEWPTACEHNLTNEGMNRLAWIGHAATCLAIQCPEYITRKAWSFLTQQQRDDANAQAENAVQLWVHYYRTKVGQYDFAF